MKRVWFFYPFVFFLVSAIDMVTTCFALWFDIPEANPLLQFIIDCGGISFFVVFKVVLTFVVIIAVESIRSKLDVNVYVKLWKTLIGLYLLAYLFFFFVLNVLTLV